MALSTAIRHLKNGDWAKAHAVVQNDSSHMGCWAHGIVHMLEGDIGNARYWYRRAGRPFPRERDASAEIDALVTEMKSQAHTQQQAAQPQQQAQNAAQEPRESSR
jgi:hypothetical protein